MPTNLATNFDPSDPELGGKIIPNGTKRVGEIVKLIDEIVSVGSASFGRITGSSPTPAGIQSMAGGASLGGTGYNDEYNAPYNHSTYDGVYFANDPALGNGDVCACFMLNAWQPAHNLVLADPVTTGSTTWNDQRHPTCFQFSSGVFQNQKPHQQNDYQKERDNDSKPGKNFFSRLHQVGDDRPNGNNTLQIDHRFFVFCADRYLIWKSVLDPEKDRTSGVGMIWLDREPSDGHYSRNEAPAIHARSFRRFSSGRANTPAHNGNGKATKVTIQDEMGFVPGNSDIQGREMIFNQRYYINDPLPAYKGEIPALKVVRDEAVATWDTVTIDGDNWVCFHRDSGRGYLTRYENRK